MLSRLPRRWKTRLRYTRQHHFIVAPHIVLFGDFYFKNIKLLVEIDGNSYNDLLSKEKDKWRSELIQAWNVQTIRLTNDQAINLNFRSVEKWFNDQCCTFCPYVRRELSYDYNKMCRNNKHIYGIGGNLTTYTK